MTREEAIKSLQNIIEYWTYKPTEVEAAKMAIDALTPPTQEQMERVFGGEWEEELEQVRREKDAAVECCRGYCESCAFERDCAKHDMNDAAPTRWYYGDCEDWEWRGPEEG